MIEKKIQVQFPYRVYFTSDSFDVANDVIIQATRGETSSERPKIFVIFDSGLCVGLPDFREKISTWFAAQSVLLDLVNTPMELPGGECSKNNWGLIENLWDSFHKAKLCRHSYVLAIGGGAFLDVVGFAAATAHRGIRLLRMPTTTLSQGDGGLGVKNGFNRYGKKNWIGTFAVPHAVINDFSLLESLPPNAMRAGIIEAIKVALIRDRAFFEYMEENMEALANLDRAALHKVIQWSADIHINHIAHSGDPFEMTCARPLDFGHWVAHKLEQVSDFRIGHGEAVAIGIAVDILYSMKQGMIGDSTAERILSLIQKIGFSLFDESLLTKNAQGNLVILDGLEEFREHLGGELTITLIEKIGQGLEIHHIDTNVVVKCIETLQGREGVTKSGGNI